MRRFSLGVLAAAALCGCATSPKPAPPPAYGGAYGGAGAGPAPHGWYDCVEPDCGGAGCHCGEAGGGHSVCAPAGPALASAARAAVQAAPPQEARP